MTDWRDTTLGAVTTKIGSGATPRGGKESYAESGIALIRSMNVLDGRFESHGLARIDDEQANQLKNVEVAAGDVLVNITGASVARSCVVPAWVLPARVNQHVAIVRLERSQAIAGFVNAYMVSPVGKGRLLSLAAGGATREALTKATLERFSIPLPPIAVQQRISAVLGTLDDLIENSRHRIELLEQMAQTIYHEWFVRFRYPGHDDNTFDPSALGSIPTGWTAIRTGDLIRRGLLDVGDGYRARNAEMLGSGVGLPFVRIANIRDGYLWLPECDQLPLEYRERLGAKVSRPGDTVISTKGTVGRCAYIDRLYPPVAYSPQVSYWRSHDAIGLPPSYIHFWLRSNDFTLQCAAVKGATDMADYVNLKDQRNMILLRPATQVTARFEEVAGLVLSTVGTLRLQSERVVAMRNRLLPRLVTGQVNVSELDLDAVLESVV